MLTRPEDSNNTTTNKMKIPLINANERAMTACEILKSAYDAGGRNGGSIEWSDIDAAYKVACQAVRAAKRDAKKLKSKATK